MSVWRCWPKGHGIAGEVEAVMRCAEPSSRTETGTGTRPGPVSKHIDYSIVLPGGLEALLADAAATQGDRQQIRGWGRRGILVRS